jgi:hypothetical protein
MSSEQSPRSESENNSEREDSSKINKMFADLGERAAERAQVIREIQECLIQLGCPCVVVYSRGDGVPDPNDQGGIGGREVIGYIYGDPNLKISNRLYVITARGLLACDVPLARFDQGFQQVILSKIQNLFLSGELMYMAVPGKSFENFLTDYLLLDTLPRHLEDRDGDVAEMGKLVVGLQQELERRRARQEEAENAVLKLLKRATERKDTPPDNEPPKPQ